MEYVAGPSLANALRDHPDGLPLDEARHWMKGLVEGVAYLHDHGLVHRDLKPANLFMEEGTVKIGDYGLAKLITASHGSEHSESIGTCHYMAPEIGSGKYHKPIDVYAMGVILFEMLTGRVPFDGESVNEVLMKHLTARPDVSKLPEPYRGIVARALSKDPDHRPARVHALLVPEDAPRAPDVRFIGDGRKGAAANGNEPQRPEPARPADDVHRIEAEEPIFYIGPDTQPPRSKPTIQDRLRANWQAMQDPGKAQKVGRCAARRARRAAARAAYVAPRQPVFTPPEPPLKPSPRARVAELTASMLWAALVIGLLSVPAAAALNINLDRDPQQLAYLTSMGLWGAWIALIINKALEERTIDTTSRRLVAMLGGAALGGFGIFLGQALHVGLAPQHMAAGASIEPIYLGLVFAGMSGWRGQTARDRKRRFRIWPIAVTAVVAALLSPLWPYEQPAGLMVAVLIATTVQIVSPWSEEAARYASYVRNIDKSQRKTKTV
jgi:FtsH-binding integral membrane protein